MVEYADVRYGRETIKYPLTFGTENSRINRAKELIVRGMRGREVAQQLGYSNASAFCRAFKEQTGQTTRQFLRESAQNAINN